MTSTQLAQTSYTTDDRAPRWLRGLFVANLVAQVGIVVTGGLVRLTGSGLGCPTWPQCVDGSLLPTAQQEEAWHKYVEFGNRLLTFVLAALAVAAIAGAIRWGRARRRVGSVPRRGVTLLALVPLLGTLAQAVLGGVTVLTGLHPATVAAHFLLSIVIIGGCAVLIQRSGEDGDRPVRRACDPTTRRIALSLLPIGFLLVSLGTVVTGSGPHSGDAGGVERFPFPQVAVARVHSLTAWTFLLVLVALLVRLRAAQELGTSVLRHRARLLLLVVAANVAVGYAQLVTGLAWPIVSLHMLLACLLWVGVVRLALATRVRGRELTNA